jgi:hypothetical protein
VLPVTMTLRYGSPALISINNSLMMVQYSMFMMFLYVAFIVVTIVLIPVAWIVGIVDKLASLSSLKNSNDRIMNVFIFIPFGPIILLCDALADLYYFWINNFRTNLKKIIIEREKTTVTHYSIKEFHQILSNFQKSKIKSAFSSKYIEIFRKQLNVNQNLLFLIFGQMIPEGGFKDL